MGPELEEVLRTLDWMRRERIWPNGPRYLWTDRSNDEYDRNAITHVMACSSLLPGKLIRLGGG